MHALEFRTLTHPTKLILKTLAYLTATWPKRKHKGKKDLPPPSTLTILLTNAKDEKKRDNIQPKQAPVVEILRKPHPLLLSSIILR